MKKMICFFVVLGNLSSASYIQDAWAARIFSDVKDTCATGMPVAVFAGLWWAIANRVPRSWVDLPEPAAGFIRTTWKEQGYKDADAVSLKEIPADSIFGKIIMYTQELPRALAVGIPFRTLIEKLLAEKKALAERLACAQDPETRAQIRNALCDLEKKLNECRFVCGHERVHKENNHTFHMLLIQFIAPFVVYSILKHTAQTLDKHALCPEISCLLRKSITRSLFEMVIFWCSAHWYEREADLHASSDPEVIKAGIALFERAHANRERGIHMTKMYRTMLVWFLKYTHPTTCERVAYLKKALVKATKIQQSAFVP